MPRLTAQELRAAAGIQRSRVNTAADIFLPQAEKWANLPDALEQAAQTEEALETLCRWAKATPSLYLAKDAMQELGLWRDPQEPT